MVLGFFNKNILIVVSFCHQIAVLLTYDYENGSNRAPYLEIWGAESHRRHVYPCVRQVVVYRDDTEDGERADEETLSPASFVAGGVVRPAAAGAVAAVTERAAASALRVRLLITRQTVHRLVYR